MADLIKPKEITVKNLEGEDLPFTISRFPAVAGREIVCKYPLTAMPKLGDYHVNEETMLKAMSYVSVTPANGEPIRLTNRTLVDNHVPDFECLMRLEAALLEYNTSFFGKDKASAFFAILGGNLRGWITKTLTALLAESLQAAKRPSTN